MVGVQAFIFALLWRPQGRQTVVLLEAISWVCFWPLEHLFMLEKMVFKCPDPWKVDADGLADDERELLIYRSDVKVIPCENELPVKSAPPPTPGTKRAR